MRKTTKKGKRKIYTNYLLVESVSTPKGPRQNTVCSLGDLGPRPRREWLKLVHKVEEALAGQGDLFQEHDEEVGDIVAKIRKRRVPKATEGEEVVGVLADQVSTEEHREAGAVHVGYQFWQRLRFDQVLAEAGLEPKARKLSCAMVMNRLVEPCSEHAMAKWLESSAVGDIVGLNLAGVGEDRLYRNMDKLYPARGVIEGASAKRARELFGLNGAVLLYDLTSSYFEGQALKNPKAKRGYSRDKRPDCKQIVVGLVLDAEGFPLAHEVFEGNVQDRKTLGQMLDLLDERVGLREGQTVVVDRGMAYEENIEEIRSRGLHYLVATRQSERDRWLGEFMEAEGFAPVERMPSPNNPYQKKSAVRVQMRRLEDETHVLCWGEQRVEKDRAIRQKQQRRLQEDLVKLQRRIDSGRLLKDRKIFEAIGRIRERYPRVARYYEMSYEAGRGLLWEIHQERLASMERLDGTYLLKTDRQDLTADEGWRTYMLLTRAESAFRSMKSPLAERPIFHQIQSRTETHVLLCVMAYHLLVAIEKTLRDRGMYTSWATVRETLKDHTICTVVMPTDSGAVLRIRKGSTPEPKHKELYKLLGISPQIINPKKTWSEAKPYYSDEKTA
ncbi:MAG: IS1634 family transposase [Thermodesulfobacteriota bacterium]